MSNWKYTDMTGAVVARILEDGSTESCFTSALDPDTQIDPYVAPVPSASDCLVKIDADADAIYGAVLGNRSSEYEQANIDAVAFKGAGYTGPVPGSVQSWATAKGWTATQAADNILATAAQWIAAQSAIRASRLGCKEQVRNATDGVGIATAMAAWAAFVTAIRGQLGLT